MKDKESRRGPFTLDSIKSSIGMPLFHAAWLFALGIVIAHYLWLRPAWLLVSLGPIAVLSSLAAFRAQRGGYQEAQVDVLLDAVIRVMLAVR